MVLSISTLSIPDVWYLEPRVFSDSRGYFKELFRASEASELGLPPFVQENESRSDRGVLRGLHFQLASHAQGKLVRCVQGRLFDVAVDLRRESPTYAQWVGRELTGDNHGMLYIPPGFAHGFYTFEDRTILNYKLTDYYAPDFELSLAYNDPDVGIEWPLVGAPILSSKDQDAPELKRLSFDFPYSPPVSGGSV